MRIDRPAVMVLHHKFAAGANTDAVLGYGTYVLAQGCALQRRAATRWPDQRPLERRAESP